MPLPPCPQGSPWEPEPAVPASISAEGVGPEQSSPSLDKGLKYPPGPWHHSCCGQTRGAGLVPQTHPQPGSPTSVLSLRYRPIHIPGESGDRADQGPGWGWGPSIWASVSPRSRMATVSLVYHWGDVETQGRMRLGPPNQRSLPGPWGWDGEGWLAVSDARSVLRSVSVPPSPPALRHGWAPGPAGRAMGPGGRRSRGAAHRRLQHPELWRQ